LKQSIRHFDNAIAADPRYVPALAALATSQVTLNLYGVVDPDEVMPRAKEAAERALALNSKSAGALTARACLRAIYDWDWAGAESDFQCAIAADSQYALAYHWYANNLLIPRGRFDEAREHIRLAAAIDPQSPAIAVAIGLSSYFERRYLHAIDEYLKAIRIDPGFGMAHYFLGQAYIQARAYSRAIDSLQLAMTLTKGSPEALSLLGYAHAANGNTPAASDCLNNLLREAKTKFVSPVLIAQICTALGRTDEALGYLDQAIQRRAADLIWLNVRPTFDPIRTDDRFKQICSRMGFQPRA
jgi:serine/threonine-protein kinase